MARAQKRMALSRQQGIGRSFAERFPAPVESTTDTGDELSRMLARAPAPVPVMSPEAQALMSRQGPRGIMASPRAAVRPQQSQPQRQQAAQASTGIAIPQTGMTPEERQFYEAQRAALEGRKARPESLTRAEQGLADLARAQIEAQQRESEEFRREAMERRDAALARSQRNFWEDPQALLALAGGIDTRRGQGAGSLARGLASIMGQQEGMAEAARKEYAQAQQMQRTLDAAVRNTQMLEAQRQVALANNEYGLVNELDDKILQSRGAEAAAKRAIADKEFSQGLDLRKTAATERQARASLISAGKPSEFEQRRRLFETNPELARTMFGIGSKEDSVQLRALKDEEQQLLKRLEATYSSQERAPITARLEQISRDRVKLMGGTPTATPADGVVTPKSQAEFNALPKGARYINPADGKEYIKN